MIELPPDFGRHQTQGDVLDEVVSGDGTAAAKTLATMKCGVCRRRVPNRSGNMPKSELVT